VVRKGFVSTVTDNVKKVTGKDPIKLAQYAKDYASASGGLDQDRRRDFDRD
jgi:hypothetical protein